MITLWAKLEQEQDINRCCHDVKQLLMLRKLTITMTVPVCLLPFSFFCLFCLKETIGLDWI